MNITIGCPGWVLEGKYFGLTLPYIEFISSFGKLYIITPKDAENPPDLDLLILPGGADINPLTYGEVPSFRTGQPNLMLEFFDERMLPFYIKNDTPIFAICRGAQKLWSYFGGKLVQHNPNHKQSSNSKDECHELGFTTEYKGREKLIGKVTSRHHQTMDSTQGVPDVLDVIAFSGEKRGIVTDIDESVVEIFRHKYMDIYGVQFHPEDNSTDRLSSLIIKELLGEA